MSFFDEIKAKGKKLKQVETKVTLPDGRTFKESDRGATSQPIGCLETKEFFVVDTSPDDLAYEVVPGLFIGSQDVAYNFQQLERHKISFILNVAVGVPLIDYENIKCKLMPLYDLPEFNIAVSFETATKFIADSIAKGAVLVHCNAGISRSSAIIAAFLIKEKKMTLEAAIELIKKARPAAKPNAGFMKQLQTYEQLILKDL